jgi:hypothetical protein
MNFSLFNKVKSILLRTFYLPESRDWEFLVFFRISIALLSILQLASVILDFQKLFGKYGIVASDIQEIPVPDYVLTLPRIITFFEKFGITESFTINAFIIFYVLFGAFLLIGLFTRVSAIIMLILYISITSGMFKYGVDAFMTSSLFYLAIFPSGNNFSLDNRIFKLNQNINLTPYKKLFQYHVIVSYFFSGLAKSFGNTWWNGEAIWKAINLPGANEFFKFNFKFLAENSILLIFMGWCVVALELLYPIFISWKKTRKVWLYLVILMHIGIAVILNLYFFAAVMIIWNIGAFYFDTTSNNNKTIKS